MSQIFAKICERGGEKKYRKLASTKETVYSDWTQKTEGGVLYSRETLAEEAEWYFIRDFSESGYAPDILKEPIDSVDYKQLTVEEFSKLDYLFVEEEDRVCFQNITKARVVRRKMIIHIGNDFRYDPGPAMITLNEVPDAVYVRAEDRLYFRRFSSITGIFTGIGQIYRTATEEDTAAFLNSDFITLKNDFSSKQVKTANRKRIALAQDTLSRLQAGQQKEMFQYIHDYCPNLQNAEGSFEIGSEEELRLLLFGIEERFYTTLIGNEKRIANSVIPLG